MCISYNFKGKCRYSTKVELIYNNLENMLRDDSLNEKGFTYSLHVVGCKDYRNDRVYKVSKSFYF